MPMRRLLQRHSVFDLQRQSQLEEQQPSANTQHNLRQQTRLRRSDFATALQKTKPSVPASSIARYEAWNRLYGSATDDTVVEEEEVDFADEDYPNTLSKGYGYF